MVPFQFSLREDPEKIFWREGLRFSVDSNREMAVLFRHSKAVDLLKMHQAVCDVLPFRFIERLGRTTRMLGLIDFLLWIVEDDLAGRGTGKDLCSPVRRIHATEKAIVRSEEA